MFVVHPLGTIIYDVLWPMTVVHPLGTIDRLWSMTVSSSLFFPYALLIDCDLWLCFILTVPLMSSDLWLWFFPSALLIDFDLWLWFILSVPLIGSDLWLCFILSVPLLGGERGGSVVECRTPEREVRGSRPTAAVLCPWARHFTPRKYWLITQEAMAPSRYDWKIVDWDVKPQHNQPTIVRQ